MRARLLPLIAIALAALAAGGAAAAAAAPAAQAKTLWLCRPGLANDPCATSLATTAISPAGATLATSDPPLARHPAFDCFYVYPTVSDARGPVAPLEVDPEERSVALYQAARYSQSCRVFAPVYRQITLQGLFHPATVTPAMRAQAYADVLAAWRDYLQYDNHGRGFVLIGHSQGSFILRQLIAQQIDGNAGLRRRLISAVILGGNVLVKQGSDVGGDFQHIPACRARTQTGCVIAYSTFDGPVPANSLFGRAGAAPSGEPPPSAGTEVLCTNPAALAGGTGLLTPVFPREQFAPGTSIGVLTAAIGFPEPHVSTPWIAAPGSYSAGCVSSNGANVLMVTPQGGAPLLHELPDASWGLHLADPSIAMGQLTAIVAAQGAAYAARQRRP
jgi:hypothetical protein